MRLPVVASKGAVEEDVLADGRQRAKDGKESMTVASRPEDPKSDVVFTAEVVTTSHSSHFKSRRHTKSTRNPQGRTRLVVLITTHQTPSACARAPHSHMLTHMAFGTLLHLPYIFPCAPGGGRAWSPGRRRVHRQRIMKSEGYRGYTPARRPSSRVSRRTVRAIDRGCTIGRSRRSSWY